MKCLTTPMNRSQVSVLTQCPTLSRMASSRRLSRAPLSPLRSSSKPFKSRDEIPADFFVKETIVIGPMKAQDKGKKKTLVLDLDETLVHSSFTPVENSDLEIQVEIDGQICDVFVKKRPFVDEFMRRMSKCYELIIYTASLSKYADPVLDFLDKEKFCAYRLFREHCTFFNGIFVKDLS